MTKITLDLSGPFLDPDGNAINGSPSLGRLLAAQLFGGGKGPALKFYDWAMTLHKDQPIEVDQFDYELLCKFVEDSDTMTRLAKGRLLYTFKEAREGSR